MAKILRDKDGATNTGYTKVSRWIKIEYTIVSPKHRLADYAEQDGAELFLNCFRYHGKQYAINQFMRLTVPLILEDGSIISGFDCTEYYKPLMIEIHPDGECVRLWEEVEIEEDK